MIPKNKIILGDSCKILKKLPEESFDLVITSPPYKDEDNFSFQLIEDVFTEVHRCLKNNELLFVNFGHLANFKSRPFTMVLMLENMGFSFQETFIWVKNHYRPIQGKKRVNNLFEYVFMFSKGKMPELDRLSVGIPYQDKSNIQRWKGTEGKDLKCAGNCLHIPYETVVNKEQKLHPDRFPVGLPLHFLKLSGIKNRSQKPVVLDPFGGSGTTAFVCKDQKVDYFLIEKNQSHWETAKKRLNHSVENLF